MKQAICTAVGRVMREPRVVTPPVGKPFVNMTVELAPRHFNGKTFSQRIDVRLYGNSLAETAAAYQPGQLVSVSGDADAFHSEIKGKHYANIRITGSAMAVTKIEPLPETQPCHDSAMPTTSGY